MNGWGPQLEDALLSELEVLPWVDFVYLFGSTARGQATPECDIDLAVRVWGPELPASPLFELLHRCNPVVGSRLHLVLFDPAPAGLRHRIFQEGQLLLERDATRRMRCQAHSLRESFEREFDDSDLVAGYLDRDSMARKLGALMSFRGRLGDFAEVTWDEFFTQPDLHDLTDRLLHMACEAVQDISLNVLVSRYLRQPRSGQDTLAILVEGGLMPTELADRLRPWEDLRSRLARGYLNPDRATSHAMLGRLQDLDAFARWCGRWLG